MELQEFLIQTQAEVKLLIDERLDASSNPYPYLESVFCEIVMNHMSEIGMTFDPQVCHYSAKVGNSNLKLSGYAMSEELDQLDLFVSLYGGGDEVISISDTETKTAAKQCLEFFTKCINGKILSSMDDSYEAYGLAEIIHRCYQDIDQIRIYVLTDRYSKSKNFKAQEVSGKTVKLEVMDIERLYRHWSEGKPRDELVVNFVEVSGSALPCVYVPGEITDYDYALTAIPAEALRFLYEKYGARLLEANVRSFLSVTGKVNKGIQQTLRTDPERFMAYNNGIVIVADEVSLGTNEMGAPSILWLKGMQIVNGGQTTASLYFTRKKYPEVELNRVRVPAKIIILKTDDALQEEILISDISKYANSQNAVKVSDLAANKAFHVSIEKLALSIYCPDGISRWFYERAAGSYNVMLAREGTTPARLKRLKESVPSNRKITKTDLAKYINAWQQKPHIVSLGSQNNFKKFMEDLAATDNQDNSVVPDSRYYKHIIAQTILFKTTQKLTRPLFKAFWANIIAYTVSLIANRIGERLDLDKIWSQQDLSPQLKQQIEIWAKEVDSVLNTTAGGKMISEWAKKSECWNAVNKATYSAILAGIPELRP